MRITSLAVSCFEISLILLTFDIIKREFHLLNNDITSSETENPHNFYHAYGHGQMITMYFI